MSAKEGLLRHMLRETLSREEYPVSDIVHLVKPVYVLEPEVAALWFVRKRQTDAAAALRIRSDYVSGRIALTAPDCLFVHLAAGLATETGMPPGDIGQAMRSLAAMSILTPMSLEAACRATEIASQAGLSMEQAFYLAEAEVTGARLLTVDKEMASRFYACLHIGDYV